MKCLKLRKLAYTWLTGGKPEIHHGYRIACKELAAVHFRAIQIPALKTRKWILSVPAAFHPCLCGIHAVTCALHVHTIRIFFLQGCQLFFNLLDLPRSVIQSLQLLF